MVVIERNVEQMLGSRDHNQKVGAGGVGGQDSSPG